MYDVQYIAVFMWEGVQYSLINSKWAVTEAILK